MKRKQGIKGKYGAKLRERRVLKANMEQNETKVEY